ncbi:hypothetical protein U1Q18_015705 [Sarracenia purpurea var. burkii]
MVDFQTNASQATILHQTPSPSPSPSTHRRTLAFTYLQNLPQNDRRTPSSSVRRPAGGGSGAPDGGSELDRRPGRGHTRIHLRAAKPSGPPLRPHRSPPHHPVPLLRPRLRRLRHLLGRRARRHPPSRRLAFWRRSRPRPHPLPPPQPDLHLRRRRRRRVTNVFDLLIFCDSVCDLFSSSSLVCTVVGTVRRDSERRTNLIARL